MSAVVETVNGYKLTTAISTFWNILNRSTIDEEHKIIKNLNLWSIELILTDKNYYFETIYLFYFTYITKINYNFIYNVIKIENQYDQHGLSNDVMVYIFYINQYMYNAMEYSTTPYIEINTESENHITECDISYITTIINDIEKFDDIEYVFNYFTEHVIDPNYKNYNVMWELIRLLTNDNLFTLFNSFRKKYHPSIYNRTDLYYQIAYGLLFLCKNYMYFPPINVEINNINQKECWDMFNSMNKKYLVKLESEISKKINQQQTENKTKSKTKRETKRETKSNIEIINKNKNKKYVSALYVDLRNEI